MKRDSFKPLLLAIILLLSSSFIWAQNIEKGKDAQKTFSQYSINRWNNENGLPGNAVKDIIKTSDGYIWIATFDGLARFDGIKFTVFDKDTAPNFKTNGILSLFEDHHKNLWLGTDGTGVLKYQQGKFDTIQTSPTLKNAFITSFAQTKDGTIWVGTKNGLAKLTDNQLTKVNEFPSLRTVSINSLLVDAQDNLWIATSNTGLIKKSDNYIKQYTTNEGVISNSFGALFEDSKKTMWAGTDNGLMAIQDGYHIDNLSNKYNLPHGFINTIFETEYGDILIGTTYGLLWIRDDNIKIYTEKDGLPNNNVTAIINDGEGSLWVGTYKGGLVRLKDGLFLNYGIKEGLHNNFINTIYEVDSIYYIGTEGGISIFHDGIIKNYSSPNNSAFQNWVKAFLKDDTGNLWVGTYDGLYKFDKGLKKVLSKNEGLSSNKIRSIIKDDKNQLWVGTANGINIINKNHQITILDKKNGLQSTFIMCLSKNKNGSILIGTNGGGLSMYKDREVKTFTMKDGLAGNVVFNIFQENNGLIWLSTDNGICSYDGKSFTTYNVANKLFKIAVFQTIIDESNKVWVATGKGIYTIDKKYLLESVTKTEDITAKIKLYDKAYGMRSMGINGGSSGILDEQGKIWFPTAKGISILDTKAVSQNLKRPTVVIEKVMVGKNKFLPYKNLKIEAESSNIEIHYTGLYFFAPERIQFQYKLEPFDKEWINARERRIAYYNNLLPGNYTFKVRAANDGGVWHEDFKSIKLTKEAYYYQENWFKALIGLVLLALAVALYFFQVWGIKSKNLKLAGQVKKRTEDINAQKEALERINASKDKLLSIISHDLKGPLKSIRQILSLMSSGHVTQDEFKSLTNNLQQDVGNSVNLLDNLLNWSKSQMHGIKVTEVEIDLHEIINENYKLFKSSLDKNKLSYTNEVPVGEIALADFNMIKLVIRNLIANAIKFTPQGGKISIFSNTKGTFLEVSVSDTGIGMTNIEKEKIFEVKESFTKIAGRSEAGTGLGLILCKEFIEKNGGTIKVNSQKGKGSIFTFTIKKAN